MGEYYFIKSQQNGLVLDVEHSQQLPGSRVSPWRKNDSDAQQWRDDPQTGTIRTRLNDFCMDIEANQLVINPHQEGKANQQWERDGRMIRNRVERNLVLDMSEKKERSAVYPYQEHGRENQCWTFELA
jgi:hypothetical protein